MITSFMNGVSFLWALLVVALFASLWGVRAWRGYKNLEQDAAQDWDYRVSKNMQDLRLSKDAYIRVYKKTNAPRAQLYLAIGGIAIIILTPLVLSLGSAGLQLVYEISGRNRVYEPGYLVWMFFLFFIVITLWVIIGALVARRYHKNHPGLMRDLILEEHASFVPNQPLIVGANPVHIDGRDDQHGYEHLFTNVLGLTARHDRHWNDSGHECILYSDGSDIKICVHTPAKNREFTRATHPFFIAREHAREDDVKKEYTLIFLLDNAHGVFNTIKGLGFVDNGTQYNELASMHSFTHKNMTFYLYEKHPK